MEDRLTFTLQDAIRAYDEAEDASREERKTAERCRDYYDGKQYTDDEIATLEKRGQPAVVINKIKRKVDFLRGFMSQQNVAPKALPRTPEHEDAAHAATDALRFVADNVAFDEIDAQVFEDRAIEGIGAVEFEVVRKKGQFEIQANRIPWDRYGRDPHSRKADFSDATYHFYITWMDQSEAEELWPEGKDIVAATVDGYAGDETYEDRPHWQIWADGNRRRVKILRLWMKRGGDWYWCTFTRGGFLDKPAKSPYMNEDEETLCPIVVESAYTDRENRRYGIVVDMLSPQDEVNKRRGKALHLLNSRQTKGTKGAVDSVAKAKRELASPDGHIEVTPNMEFELLSTNDMSAGQFSLMQQASEELEAMGPNASLLGKEDKELSGRAIRAQQQGGMIEISGLTSGQRSWRKRCYRVMWAMVRQFWTEQRWVRVTDDDRGFRFVGLNQPVTAQEYLARQGVETPPGFEGDPRLLMEIGIENEVAAMDIDIILEEGADPMLAQEESFDALLKLAEIYNGQGQPFPADVIAEVMPNLRNRETLLERIRGGTAAEEQAQIEAAKKQAFEQAEMAKTDAEVRKLNAEAAEEESRAMLQHAQLRYAN